MTSTYHKREMPVVSHQLPVHSNYSCSPPLVLLNNNTDDHNIAYSMLLSLLLSRAFVCFVCSAVWPFHVWWICRFKQWPIRGSVCGGTTTSLTWWTSWRACWTARCLWTPPSPPKAGKYKCTKSCCLHAAVIFK